MTLYNFIKAIVHFIFRIFFRIRITGKENIPVEGQVIICSNHTNILDPIMVAFTTKRPIHFMGKKELFENSFLNWFLKKMNAFPVDRDASDIAAIKTSLKILKNNEVLGIFPEGTRVDGFNKDNAKAGVAMIAVKTNSPIIPIRIESDYKLFKKVNITIGKPFMCDNLEKKKLSNEDYKKMSEDILYTIYNL